MKSFFIFTAAFLFSIQSFAQAPAIQWQKSLGGSEEERAQSIQQTSDGGYIVAGSSKSNDGDVSGNHGNFDFWVVKLNNSGNIQWQKSLGGSESDRGTSVQQTSDGGFIVTGSTFSNDGDVGTNHGTSDIWVVKLDNSGNLQWEKSFGSWSNDGGSSVKETTDGGYIVAGNTWLESKGTDYKVIKLDSSGNIQWQKNYGGSKADYASSIQQTSDGGYVIGGNSWSNDGDVTVHYGTSNYYDCWIVKTDSLGNIEWQKTLGGTYDDVVSSIRQTPDGGYIVAASSSSNDFDVSGHHGDHLRFDYWVVKLDTSGNIQWEKSIGGTGGDRLEAIHLTSDGGYILAGYTDSEDGDVGANHGGTDGWVVKINNSGIIQWEKSYGGSDIEIISSFQNTAEGGFIFAGGSKSDDGDVTGNHGNYDYWIVKLSPEGLGVTDFDNQGAFSIYPNPVRNTLMISGISPNTKIMISGLNGEIIKEFTAKSSLESIDVSGLPAGVYFVNGKKFIKK